MSNRDHLTIDQLTGQRRMRTRAEKIALAVSMLAFFGAIGVVGWFGLTGYQANDGAGVSGPRVLFEGGVSRTAGVPAPGRRTAANLTEDEYVVGNFGDPVDELYADDDDGGWGTSALQQSSGASGDVEGGPPRVGRIRRGRGGVD